MRGKARCETSKAKELDSKSQFVGLHGGELVISSNNDTYETTNCQYKSPELGVAP